MVTLALKQKLRTATNHMEAPFFLRVQAGSLRDLRAEGAPSYLRELNCGS
jgi:hypothetical protein